MAIKQKGESQIGYYKKTKHTKFSEKWLFLTPWYADILASELLLCSIVMQSIQIFYGVQSCVLFYFRSIIIFILNCALWYDKNGTKWKYILLQFYHFTYFRQKSSKNKLILTLTITITEFYELETWARVIQTFVICEKIMLLLFYSACVCKCPTQVKILVMFLEHFCYLENYKSYRLWHLKNRSIW